MRIALIGDCVFPTPKPNGHGLGYVVHRVAEGLKARAHEVVLFAKPGSRFSGELITPDDANGYEGEAALTREAMRQHRARRFDAIFDHSHLHYFSQFFPDVPVLNVFHDIFQEYARCPVMLSKGQRALMPAPFERAAVVHNTLDADGWPFSETPDPKNYVLFVGALSEIKQPMLAVEACARMGVQLVVAGQPLIGHVPFADLSNVTYVGEISGPYKRALYAGARVFLQLGTGESFGLTTIEAGLSGTPVVAWPAGGNLDTVMYGVNGVHVPPGSDKTQSVVDAIERAWDMPRQPCRQWAERFTNLERQLDAYETLLTRVVMGEVW